MKWVELALKKIGLKTECIRSIEIKDASNTVMRGFAALLAGVEDYNWDIDKKAVITLTEEWCGRIDIVIETRTGFYDWMEIRAVADNGAERAVGVRPKKLSELPRAEYERYEKMLRAVQTLLAPVKVQALKEELRKTKEELEKLQEQVKPLKEELRKTKEELEKLRRENEELQAELEKCRPVDECMLHSVRYPIEHPGQLAGVLRRLGCM